ncbi:hypothetical protein M422DRAFT_47919 [Sphaerobolus stellatus SS14]|uniref:Uncharacterized protein n=1 Tax=Sphaerobolus stellatus (strain SS14) TaxID=990650 RepID=A0A0C9VWP1_SPHS4|nr:hypothetical protein M422DRAFT_47919 [Sphaerobolus stellatus SS14]
MSTGPSSMPKACSWKGTVWESPSMTEVKIVIKKKQRCILPLEPNGPSKEEFAGWSDETMQGSDELEDLLNISWTSLKEEDYLVAHLVQELVRSHKELCKYMAAIHNNVKSPANKVYILEDELFCKLLNMQKSSEWSTQMNDLAIIVQQANEALLDSYEHRHFDLMAALRV